jgi:hypothetical protein
MSDCTDTHLCAVGCEEDVFVDKMDILIELDGLCGNLDNALHYLLAFPPHRVTLHEDQASPNHFECNITTRDTTCTDICPDSAVEGKIIFSNKSFA